VHKTLHTPRTAVDWAREMSIYGSARCLYWGEIPLAFLQWGM